VGWGVVRGVRERGGEGFAEERLCVDLEAGVKWKVLWGLRIAQCPYLL
jgi:hypothetical protein